MEAFGLNIPCLEKTLDRLNTAIQDMDEIRLSVKNDQETLLSGGFSGAASVQFSLNAQKWEKEFTKYIDTLKLLQEILSADILPLADTYNEKALSFSGIFDGAVGMGQKNQLSFSWDGKEEVCTAARNLDDDYEEYTDQLQQMLNQDDSLRFTSFSVRSDIRSCMEEIRKNQDMIYQFTRELDGYQEGIERLNQLAVQRFSQIAAPEEWDVVDSLNFILLTGPLHRLGSLKQNTGLTSVTDLKEIKSPAELYQEMVNLDDSKNVSSYNWDLIESIMQSDPEAWDTQALTNYQALAMLFESMEKAEDLERFINCGYRTVFSTNSQEDKEGRRKLIENSASLLSSADSYYFFSNSHIPAVSPVLKGIKDYYLRRGRGIPEAVIYNRDSYNSEIYDRARLELGKMALLEDICNYAEYLEVSTTNEIIPAISIQRNGLLAGDFIVKIPDTYPQIPSKNLSVYTFRNGYQIDSVVHSISTETLSEMVYEMPDFMVDTAFTAVGILAAAPIAIPTSIIGYAKGAVGAMETGMKSETIIQNMEFVDYIKALEMNVVVTQVGDEAIIVNQVSMNVCDMEKKLEYYNSENFNIGKYNDSLRDIFDLTDKEIATLNIGIKPYTLNDVINGLNKKDNYSEKRLEILIQIDKITSAR